MIIQSLKCAKKTKSLVMTEGGQYGFEFLVYVNQAKECKKLSKLAIYVLKNICVQLEVAILYVRWFSCVEFKRLCKNAVWCWYKVMIGLFDLKFGFRLLIEHLYYTEFKSAIIYCSLVMTFFILTRFVLVKYSCTCRMPVIRYFLLGLATHYRESCNYLLYYYN